MFEQVLAYIREMAANTGDIRLLARRFENPRLYAAWAAVIALHLVAIWILASGLVLPRGADGIGREVQIAFVPGTTPVAPKMEPVAEPQMQAADPTEPTLVPPQIDIDAAAPSPMAGASQADILPPRPDPAHQNAGPSLPASFPKSDSPMQVMLTILVQPDGSVSDARIAQSSNQSVLDQLALAYVKAKWRFRAALQNGRPVQDWTTVLVRFAG